MITMQDMAPIRETERLRAEFLAMVSHELRAPLTSIRGSATILLEDAAHLDPAEMAQFHRIIRDQSSYMRSLIGDLLDVARIETGALGVELEPSDLAPLVEEARNAFLNAEGRSILRIDLPPDLPRIMADRRRIVQVLGNLLSNAAGHAPESPEIRVASQREGPHVVVSIADQGPESRTTVCLASSGSSPPAARGSRVVPDWAWPSAAVSWRPTGDASGWKPADLDWARGSCSPFRHSRTGPLLPAVEPRSHRPKGAAPVSWQSTMTPRPCGTCGTHWVRRATNPSSPATQRRYLG